MVYRFGSYLLRTQQPQLLHSGEPVPATPKVLTTLLVLVRAQGRVVTREELLSAVWPDSFVERGSLAQNIFVLRKMLAADFPDIPPIETLPRIGYRFRIPVEAVEESDLHPATPIASSTAERSGPMRETGPREVLDAEEDSGTRTVLWTAAGGLWALGISVVLLAVIGAFRIARIHSAHAVTQPAPATVAVLNFRNLAPAPDTDWISVAMREMLSTELESGSALLVLPEQGVDRAERELRLSAQDGLSPESVKSLCVDLGCDQLVSGSYLVQDGQLRLDLHVLNAHTGTTIASYSLDQPESQLRLLIAQGSRVLRQGFGLASQPQEFEAAVKARSPANPEAYRLYIEGTERLRSYDGPGASKLLERSVALDPNFALSHSALSLAYSLSGHEPQADAEAARALALDGGLSREDQLMIQGRAQRVRHQYASEVNTYRTLFTFFPSQIGYGIAMADAMGESGQGREAIAELERLMQRPGSEGHDPQLYSAAADACSNLGDWPCSLSWAEKMMDECRRRGARLYYGRALTTASQAHLYMHQLAPALAETQEALGIARDFHDSSGELRALNRLGQIYTAQHKLSEARSVLQEALQQELASGEVMRQIHTLSDLGNVLSEAGQHTQALHTFEREVQIAKSFEEPEFRVAADFDLVQERSRTAPTAATEQQLVSVVQRAAEVGDKETEVQALLALAGTRLRLHDNNEGLKDTRTALDLAGPHASPQVVAQLLDVQANLCIAKGDLGAARQSLAAEKDELARTDDAVFQVQFRDTYRTWDLAQTKASK